MRRLTPRALFSRYAIAWIYLAGVTGVGLCYAALSRHDQAVLVRWASTSVANLEHHPVLCLVVSAFVPAESLAAWPALIALALFGANRVLGNWRTAVVLGAAQVAGTLVSEGIVAYRLHTGVLPAAARHLVDIGPSYVVAAAIAVALMCGSQLARGAALADLAVLVFAGHIFAGLSRLQVAAVGHVTALAIGALAGGAVLWQRQGQLRASRQKPGLPPLAPQAAPVRKEVQQRPGAGPGGLTGEG